MTDERVIACRASCFEVPRDLWWPYPPGVRPLPMTEVSVVTFEVETDGGRTGLGFAQSRGRGGKPVQSALEHLVAPQLIDQSLEHPELAWDRLHGVLSRLGSGGVGALALSLADMALWDLAAKIAERPLFKLLGARREAIPAYGTMFDRLYSDEELVEEAKEFIGMGMDGVKVRAGLGLTRDRERLGLVRSSLGSDVHLMVDANANWDLPDALRHLRMLEEHGVELLEEPIAPTDADGFAELQAHTTIPIAGGENLYTIAEFTRFVRRGALRLLQPDIARIGGVTAWLRVAALADAFGLPVAAHLNQEVSVHVLCSARNATLLEYTRSFDALVETPLTIRSDGAAVPPSVPGIGVQLRWDLLEPYRC